VKSSPWAGDSGSVGTRRTLRSKSRSHSTRDAKPGEITKEQLETLGPACERGLLQVCVPGAEAAHRIRIEFLEESWVEIRDGHGKLLHAQLNSAGSEVRVEGQAPLSFVIGNAQNVRLSYNGSSVDLTPYIRVAVARFKLP